MNDFVIDAPASVSLPIVGSNARFPVRRIYCVGRNYADHAVEMGIDPRSEPPFFFLKPADAVLQPGESFPYPPGSQNVHHEVELVVALGQGGKDIPFAAALDHVFGYTVGLDMTRRDLQLAARAKGRPWDVGKAFDHSAPLAALVPAAICGHPNQGRIWLDVNGARRQSADLRDLIWPVAEVIGLLSQLFELRPGDIIMTGTPAGVGPVVPGDSVEAGIDGVATLSLVIGGRDGDH
ncbi:fumarylacetoacetate hydrolase family protein [Mesorhizobium loti]|uniref:fumarylacetoacetate hydrolase family protein n=1 Tax=Rhizobium loti TaxID=381 RepID=UPI00042065EC|nr:fumarylacetoacetate hydrolase family protein [Mesorhizobium loti]